MPIIRYKVWRDPKNKLWNVAAYRADGSVGRSLTILQTFERAHFMARLYIANGFVPRGWHA